MTNDIVEIPEWPGGECLNDRCPGSNQHRILSVEEIQRVYPVKDKFDWWPLPPDTTHVCTICGFCYSGVSEAYTQHQQPTGPPQIELDIEAWDWEFESQFDSTVREAVKSFVRGAPDELTADEIAAGVNRFVAGADGDFALDVMSGMDDFEKPARTIDEFM